MKLVTDVEHEMEVHFLKLASIGTPSIDDDELSETSKCCDCDKADSDTVLCKAKMHCTLYTSQKYKYKIQNPNHEIQNTKYNTNTNNCCDCDKADSDTVLCEAKMHTVHFSEI